VDLLNANSLSARAIPCFVAAVLCAALMGCATSSPDSAEAPKNRTIQANLVTNKPSVRPADTLNGRIIAVKEPLRFVIVDFSNSRMPRIDQRLNVYRLDQKVAEVKISGPYLDTTVAADIIAGQAYEGDLVRDR
jgi:hypothetical protein